MMLTVTEKQNICPAGREAHSAMQEPVQYNTNLKEHVEISYRVASKNVNYMLVLIW